MLEFKLYSRSNCHLCEDMEEQLSPFIEKYDITVNRQYIDNEPALVKLYGEKVPVLMFNDDILCHYFLDAELFLSTIKDNL